MSSTNVKVDFFTSQTNCPVCFQRVISAFEITTGIKKVEITNKSNLKVNYDKKLLTEVALRERFLYTAKDILNKYVHQRFIVRGMDCPSCAAKVEKIVNKIEGVSGSSMNFGTGTLDVEYNTFIPADENQIKKNVERQTGYSVFTSAKGLRTSTSILKNKKFQLLLVVGIVFLLSFLVDHLFLHILAFSEPILEFIEISIIGIYLLTILVTSYDLIRSVFFSLKAKSFNIDSLMLIAIIGATIIGQFEEAAMVSFLFFAGNMLEEYSLDKMRRTIDDLVTLNPDMVELKNGEKIKVEDAEPGEIVVYRPGDIIALDGKVVEGITTINEATITGESIPDRKILGSSVYAGTTNLDGYIEILVEKRSTESVFARIIQMVEEARTRKAPAQKFAEAFGKYYTPTVFVGAVMIALFGGYVGFSSPIYIAITLLVVSCPCALVISTPVAIVSAIENSARNGVLVKGGVHLEKAAKVDTIFFDKTGTVTEGRHEVEEIITLSDQYDENTVLKVAAALESLSEHPIASAIVISANERRVKFDGLEVMSFQTIPGKGVKGVINGKQHIAGTPSFLSENGYTSADTMGFIREPGAERSIGRSTGQTRVYVGIDSVIIGLIALVDKIRPDGAAALNELQAQDYHLVMLTGDNVDVARKVSTVAGIKEFYASLLPQDKETKIKERQQEGHKVAMLGDGINDTLALVAADAGIAMGGIGSPTTIETADIVLMNDDLHKIPPFMMLAKKTMTTIKLNIGFSLLVIALLLLSSLSGWLTLSLGVIGHEGSALLVIFNGMRLLKFKWSEGPGLVDDRMEHNHDQEKPSQELEVTSYSS
ncbi:MAG: heavy metal translocating P-type ATPase [Candidatus Hodarchaeales archaeon]|jgi:Cd2+/Zn2+-exporting ATPase